MKNFRSILTIACAFLMLAIGNAQVVTFVENSTLTTIALRDYAFGVPFNGKIRLLGQTATKVVDIPMTEAAFLTASNCEFVKVTSAKAQLTFKIGDVVYLNRSYIEKLTQDRSGKTIINYTNLSSILVSETYASLKTLLSAICGGGGAGTTATVLTATPIKVGATTFPTGTPTQTVLAALNAKVFDTGNVNTIAPITIGSTTYATGTSTQSVLAALAAVTWNTTSVLTTAPLTIAGQVFPTGTPTQTVLARIATYNTNKFYSTQGYSLPLQMTTAEGYYTPATAPLGTIPTGGKYYSVENGNWTPNVVLPSAVGRTGGFSVYVNASFGVDIQPTNTDLPALLPISGGQGRSIHFVASNGLWRWTEAPYDNSLNGYTVAGDAPTVGQIPTYNAAGQVEWASPAAGGGVTTAVTVIGNTIYPIGTPVQTILNAILPTFTTDAAAAAGGVAVGSEYWTATGTPYPTGAGFRRKRLL